MSKYSCFLLNVGFSISFPTHFQQTRAIPLQWFGMFLLDFPILQFTSLYSVTNLVSYIPFPGQEYSPFFRDSMGDLSSHWILPTSCPSLTVEMFSVVFKSSWYQFHTCFNLIWWLPLRYFWDSHTEAYTSLRFLVQGSISQMSFWWEAQLPPSSPCFKMALMNDPQEPCQSLNHHIAPQVGNIKCPLLLLHSCPIWRD